MLGLIFDPNLLSRIFLEKKTIKGDSPVDENKRTVSVSRVLLVEYLAGMRESSTSNPKYVLSPIAYYCTVRES